MTQSPPLYLFGTHSPTIGRIGLIEAGLRAHGLDVRSCVEPAWGSTDERVAAAHRGLRNPTLMRRLAASYRRLARRLRSEVPIDAPLLVGYPGQLDVIVLRLLRPRARIILDGFVSLDETLEDRSIGGSARGTTRRAARLVDRLAFRLADRVVVDTAAHGRRLAVRYGLDLNRTVVVPVGAEEPEEPEKRARRPSRKRADLRVLYFGGFIPLHGLGTVLDAARLLGPTAGIRIDLVGDGQKAPSVERALAESPMPHVRLVRTWMPQAELVATHLRPADVALGIFARRPKTMDVVPAKLYLSMACGLPVVTADTPAVREEILDRFPADPPPVVVCPPGDPEALAARLLDLRADPRGRARIGSAARLAFEQRFTPARIVEPLLACLAELS